jgi:glycosyltransferase involved in cell wall biosynthesis
LTKYSLRKADQVIVTGRHMVDTLENVYGVVKGKVEVIPRGINLSLFRPYENRDEFMRIHKLKSGPIVFSPRYILNYVYNIDVIINSVPIVKREFPQVTYIQMLKKVEDQALFESYLELIRRHNIEENVVFHPLVDNREMPAFYNGADLCVSIPKFDGFPVSVLEGSACGTPFIVSNVPYTKEWFENGESGVVLQDVSPEALAQATIELLKDERRRREMGRMSMEKVKAGFDYHQCMENLEKIYFKLAERGN